MDIGDLVKYTPAVYNEDTETIGKILKTEFTGRIFNGPMVVIEGVEHWIPLANCEIARESWQKAFQSLHRDHLSLRMEVANGNLDNT